MKAINLLIWARLCIKSAITAMKKGYKRMSKPINTHCNNCDTQYSQIKLCDCKTEALNKINAFTKEQIKEARITGEVPF
jgi:hypothetical protein